MLSRRILLAAASLLAASAASGQAPPAKVPVVASFSIVGDIVAEIGGDRIALTTLVRPGVDAHVYQPTPRRCEGSGRSPSRRRERPQVRGMDASAAAVVRQQGRLREAAKGVPAREDKKGGHGHGHDHGGVDPHAWQSVANVRIYAANIRDALIGVDPDGRAIYEANARRYIAELDALDAEIRAAVARIPAERRKVITSHDAFAISNRPTACSSSHHAASRRRRRLPRGMSRASSSRSAAKRLAPCSSRMSQIRALCSRSPRSRAPGSAARCSPTRYRRRMALHPLTFA